MICIYITLIGSLVILIKKHVSKRIVLRIPKSNILPQPRNDNEETIEMSTLHSTPRIIEVGHNAETDTGNLSLPCRPYIFYLFGELWDPWEIFVLHQLTVFLMKADIFS